MGLLCTSASLAIYHFVEILDSVRNSSTVLLASTPPCSRSHDHRYFTSRLLAWTLLWLPCWCYIYFALLSTESLKQKAGRITASSGLLRKPYVCGRVRPLPDKSAGKIMDILSSLPLPACFVMLSATPDSRLTYFCYIS